MVTEKCVKFGMICTAPINLKPDITRRVSILNVISPTRFWVRIEDETEVALENEMNNVIAEKYSFLFTNQEASSDMEFIYNLHRRIRSEYEQVGSNKEFILIWLKEIKERMGDYALVYDPEFKQHCRGFITDYHVEDLTCSCFLIDKGVMLRAGIQLLVPLARCLASYPSFAVRCHLYDVYPQNCLLGQPILDWSKKSIFAFKVILAVNSLWELRTVNESSKIHPQASFPVILDKYFDGFSVNEIMLREGFGISLELPLKPVAKNTEEQNGDSSLSKSGSPPSHPCFDSHQDSVEFSVTKNAMDQNSQNSDNASAQSRFDCSDNLAKCLPEVSNDDKPVYLLDLLRSSPTDHSKMDFGFQWNPPNPSKLDSHTQSCPPGPPKLDSSIESCPPCLPKSNSDTQSCSPNPPRLDHDIQSFPPNLNFGPQSNPSNPSKLDLGLQSCPPAELCENVAMDERCDDEVDVKSRMEIARAFEDFDPMADAYYSAASQHHVDTDDPEFAIHGYVSREQEQICPIFTQKGHCYKGAACRYKHVQPDLFGLPTDQIPFKIDTFSSLDTLVIGEKYSLLSIHFWENYFYVVLAQDCEEHMSGIQSLDQMLRDPQKIRKFKKLLLMPCETEGVLVEINKEFQRGQCLDFDPENQVCTVLLIDTGHEKLVSFNDLRIIESRLLDLPPMARRCRLADVRALPGKEREMMEFLNNLIPSFSKMEITVRSNCDVWVNLFGDGKDVGDILVGKNLAAKVKDFFPSPSNKFFPG